MSEIAIRGPSIEAGRAILAPSYELVSVLYDLASNAAEQRGVETIQMCDVRSALNILADDPERWRQILREPEDSKDAARRAG